MTGYDRFFAAASLAITALLFAGLRPLFAGRFGTNPGGSVAYGLLVALVAVLLSYGLLRRSVGASHQTFQLVFFGGILGRFAVFGGAVGAAFLIEGLDGRVAALAILAGFLPLSALEVFCVVRGQSAGQPGKRRNG
ncbi:MAG: hypothetical protein ABIK65_01785 [Candidatus Eisenbacteria bacterium]